MQKDRATMSDPIAAFIAASFIVILYAVLTTLFWGGFAVAMSFGLVALFGGSFSTHMITGLLCFMFVDAGHLAYKKFIEGKS